MFWIKPNGDLVNPLPVDEQRKLLASKVGEEVYMQYLKELRDNPESEEVKRLAKNIDNALQLVFERSTGDTDNPGCTRELFVV